MTSAGGGIVVYRTVDGRWWVASPAIDFTVSSAAGASGTFDEVDSAVASLVAAKVPEATAESLAVIGPEDVPGWAGVAAAALLLLVLLVPAPRRGTRWFWFWLLVTSPFGLGAVSYLAAEGVLRRVSPQAARRTGPLGFVLGAALAILVTILLAGLRRAGVGLPLT